MSRALTDLQLCNAALVKLGSTPISGFDDADAAAGIASTLYPLVADAVLTAHPWSFTLKRANLTALPDAPSADFRRRFALPADFLRALYIDNRGASPRYAILGDALHSDADRVVLTYQCRTPESAFPPFFKTALTARLAAEFCIPLTENSSRAESLDRLAERELERAWIIDRSQGTPPLIADDTLTRVRF
ncbi:MAG: hypothetical protein EA356_06415 [Geminicoccaceae bacterium]|nr:MAG: hypothetical protein EA356_06415 [Geminicoccaceae bacterium]